MNGMQYLKPSFTLPTSSGRSTSEIKWDLAFLSAEEFSKKYGISVETYSELSK